MRLIGLLLLFTTFYTVRAAIKWDDTNLQTFANIVGRNIFNNGIDFTRAIFEAKPSIFEEHKEGGLFFNSEALLNALTKFEAYHGKFSQFFMELRTNPTLQDLNLGLKANTKNLKEKIFNSMGDEAKKKIKITEAKIIAALNDWSKFKMLKNLVNIEHLLLNEHERKMTEIANQAAQQKPSKPVKEVPAAGKPVLASAKETSQSAELPKPLRELPNNILQFPKNVVNKLGQSKAIVRPEAKEKENRKPKVNELSNDNGKAKTATVPTKKTSTVPTSEMRREKQPSEIKKPISVAQQTLNTEVPKEPLVKPSNHVMSPTNPMDVQNKHLHVKPKSNNPENTQFVFKAENDSIEPKFGKSKFLNLNSASSIPAHSFKPVQNGFNYMPSFEFDGHKLEKKKRRYEPEWPNFDQNAFNQKPTAFASNNDCSKCANAYKNEERLNEIIESLKNQLENSEKAQEEAKVKAVKLAMLLDKANAEVSHKADLIKAMEIKMVNLLETTKGRSTVQMDPHPSGPLLLKDVEPIDKMEAVHQHCLAAKKLAEVNLAESVGKINVCERELSMVNKDLATVNGEMDKAKGEFAKVNGELINAKMELNKAMEKLEKMAKVQEQLAKSKGDLAAVAKVHEELAIAKRDLAKANEELNKANRDIKELPELQEKLGKSQKRINELEKQLAEKYTKNKGQKELAETKAKLYEIEAEKDDLTEQLKSHKNQLNEMAKLTEKSKNANGQVENKLRECEKKAIGINGNGTNGKNVSGKEIQENQAKLKEIQDGLAIGLKEKAELAEEVKNSQKLLDDLNAKKRNAQIDLEKQENELKKKQTEINGMKAANNLETEINENKAKLKEIQEGIAIGLRKKEKLTEEAKNLQKLLDELYAKKQNAEIELNKKETGLKEKQTELEKMAIQLTQEADDKLTKLNLLEIDLKEKQNELDNINGMIGAKQKEADQKQTANEELYKKEMELKQNIAKLEEQMLKGEVEKKELDKQLESEKKQLDAITNLIATNDTKMIERDAKLNELQKEIEELEKRKTEFEAILAKKVKENTENAKKVDEKLAQEKEKKNAQKHEVEYPMLKNSLSFAHARGLRPCDDFYKFVCAGEDKFYKEQNKLDGGYSTDLTRIYTKKVMDILTDHDSQLEYGQKYPFMAKGFTYFNKCLNRRWNSRMAAMDGADPNKFIKNETALKRLIGKLRDQVGLNLVLTDKQHWLKLAFPYLPLVEITEVSYLVNTNANANSSSQLPSEPIKISFDAKKGTASIQHPPLFPTDILKQLPTQEIVEYLKGQHKNVLYLQVSPNKQEWIGSFQADMAQPHKKFKLYSPLKAIINYVEGKVAFPAGYPEDLKESFMASLPTWLMHMQLTFIYTKPVPLYFQLSEDGTKWHVSKEATMTNKVAKFDKWLPVEKVVIAAEFRNNPFRHQFYSNGLPEEVQKKMPTDFGEMVDFMNKKPNEKQLYVYLQLDNNGKHWNVSSYIDMKEKMTVKLPVNGQKLQQQQNAGSSLTRPRKGRRKRSVATLGNGKNGQPAVNQQQQQPDKDDLLKIKVEKIIKIDFTAKLFAGKKEDPNAWDGVKEMMEEMYRQGMFSNAKINDRDIHIQRRMEKLEKMEQNILDDLGKSQQIQKMKISDLTMNYTDMQKVWLSLIQGQFPGKLIDENTEVLIDMEMAKRWLQSVHTFSKDKNDKETFGDFLLWHQILGKIGNFSNTMEMYEKWYKVLEDEAKFLDGLYSKEKKAGVLVVDKDGQDKRTCIQEHMNVYFPHVIDRLFYEILNEDCQVEAFLAKNRQILKYVRKGFEHILREETPWMDIETRVNALEKLHKMKEFVGFLPNTLEDAKLNGEIYGDIEFVEGLHWMDMMEQMVRNRQKRNNMDRQIETIETGYDPLEQNAKYITSNQLLINAMNFMEPSFNLEFPDAYNFAAIGSTMGHEITHGFDTTGRRIFLDGIGMKDPGWWTQKSLEKFNGRKECLKAQYENYEIQKYRKMGERVDDNGKGTIGEDIADNGGLRAAYKGWEMYMAENAEQVKKSAQQIKGVLVPDGNNKLVAATQQQLFFIAFAYSQCTVTNCERKAGQVECREEDVHSTARVRVNVPLRMFEGFHKAFGCLKQSLMHPAQTWRVW